MGEIFRKFSMSFELKGINIACNNIKFLDMSKLVCPSIVSALCIFDTFGNFLDLLLTKSNQYSMFFLLKKIHFDGVT